MLWLLLAQFLLGMAVNLFVGIPAAHPGAAAHNYFGGLFAGIAWSIAHGPLLLALHVALGVALAAGSLALAIGVLALRPRRALPATVVGWVGVTGAAFNGGSFVNYGHNVSSLLMATGFAIAATCYVIALVGLLRAGDPA